MQSPWVDFGKALTLYGSCALEKRGKYIHRSLNLAALRNLSESLHLAHIRFAVSLVGG